MVGQHHQLNGPDFEKTPGDSEGQGSLAYYSPWGHKELDMPEQQQQQQMQIIGNQEIFFHSSNIKHVLHKGDMVVNKTDKFHVLTF